MNQTREVQLLAVKAQESLRDALRNGTLRDGQFVSMSQLVEILDCPLASIREAVKQASSLGWLTTLPKRGVQIMEARPDKIRECLDFRMVLDQEGARRRIAGRHFDGIDPLRTRHEEMRDASRTGGGENLPPRAISVDLSLHDFLAAGLGNSQLEAAYDANRMRIAIIQNARPFLQDRIETAMNEHIAIIDALAGRDIDATIGAIEYHFQQTLRWWGVA